MHSNLGIWVRNKHSICSVPTCRTSAGYDCMNGRWHGRFCFLHAYAWAKRHNLEVPDIAPTRPSAPGPEEDPND